MAARDSLYQNVIVDQGVMQRRGPSWKSSTGRVLEVVCDYKHVGSYVTVAGGLMREVTHRTKASQRSFCSPRRKIFEYHSLSTRIRLSLANSMCDSRLLFGFESWPCCTGSAIQKLHVQRMKWLRSIDSSEVRSSNPQSTENLSEMFFASSNKITPLLRYVFEGLPTALAS